MHEQSIMDAIISRLDITGCRFIAISLLCSEENLIQRLKKDIAAGVRSNDVIERSVNRIPLYQTLHTIKIDTSDKSAVEIAREIAAL